MRVLDERSMAVLMVGLLSSTVLLASSAQEPALSVSELWGLREDGPLTVVGILVYLSAYESGVEVLVLSDEMGSPTVKVICAVGPGVPPSSVSSIGDLLEVSGDSEVGADAPVVRCQYAGVRVVRPSEEVLTVALLGAAWDLLVGDRIAIKGVAEESPSGVWRLEDFDGTCSIEMRVGRSTPVAGPVVVDCTPVLDGAAMVLCLEVHSISRLA